LFMRLASFVRFALAAAALAASSLAVAAFPEKPIRVVIGFPAGGPLDQHARLLSDRLSAVLGQPILIDYKSGAGGTVGAQEVMKAPPDGYTLMLANTGVMVINPALYSKLPYSTLKDFTPVARTAMQPLALLVNPKVPANTLKEFIDYAVLGPARSISARPATAASATWCPRCSRPPPACTWFTFPIAAARPAFTDLMAGQVQFMAESIPQAAAYHKQGKVRALAVTSRERNPALPDTPTVIESGIKGLRGGGLLWLPGTGGHAQGRGGQAQRRVPSGAGHARHPQPHDHPGGPIRRSWVRTILRSSSPPKCHAGPRW
jgi:tripartite-type tricarboxylate transporter receptor subunit TctC